MLKFVNDKRGGTLVIGHRRFTCVLFKLRQATNREFREFVTGTCAGWACQGLWSLTCGLLCLIQGGEVTFVDGTEAVCYPVLKAGAQLWPASVITTTQGPLAPPLPLHHSH